jgi:hypothetical protein
MLSYFGGILEILLLVVGLISGALSVARDFQRMYSPARTDEKRVYWGWVRIAFVISAGLVWYNAFSSMKGRERDLHAKELEALQEKANNASLQAQVESLRDTKTAPPHDISPSPEVLFRAVNIATQPNVFSAESNFNYYAMAANGGPGPMTNVAIKSACVVRPLLSPGTAQFDDEVQEKFDPAGDVPARTDIRKVTSKKLTAAEVKSLTTFNAAGIPESVVYATGILRYNVGKVSHTSEMCYLLLAGRDQQPFFTPCRGGRHNVIR